MVHDGGPRPGRLERLRRDLRGAGGRRGVRPLAPAAPRGARRIPDLQPGQPDRAPPRSAPHDGDRPGRGRRGELRARAARTSQDRAVMDLDVLFLGTAGSAPTAQRGLPATLVRLRRRPAALRLRRGHAAPAGPLGRADRAGGGLPHPLPRRPRARAARDAEDLQPAPARAAADRLRAARASRACSRCSQPLVGNTTFQVELVELEPNDELDRDGYRIAAYEADHAPRALGYALVEDPRPGHFDPERARELGVDAGPGLRPPPAGRDGERGAARAGDGGDPARPQGRARRRRRAERDDPARGLRRRPARARGHLPRGGGRARGRDQALHRPRRRGAGGGGGRAHARAHARVHPLRRRRRCATRPARRSSA